MVKVLVPSGALGLGYDKAALARGIALKPDIIAIDGGSTDSGPHYLGTGTSKYSRRSTLIEWRGLMEARRTAGVPLVIGTAGTCGADTAVDWLVEITREIAAETGESLKLAVLKCNQPAVRIADALNAGKVTPLTPAPEISPEVLSDCTNIVALAGAEQVQAALETGADIVIAGRTTDTAIISALPLARGCHAGAAWHGAKIGECGALCATNPQSGVIIVAFDDTGFTVTPLADGSYASPHTVLAHMLYENSDPFVLYEPGGHLDVRDARYEQIDERSVRVTGSHWHVADSYTVKLEGARRAGYQTVTMATIRDPRYVAAVQDWCADIVTRCCAKTCERLELSQEDFSIQLRVVGDNATLGGIDHGASKGSEVGVLGIVTADTQALASEIAKLLNPYLLHHPLTQEEEQPTFAFPFSPPEMDKGPVHAFALNHVLHLDDPMAAFSLTTEEVSP